MEDKQQNKRIFETLFFLLFFYYDYVLCVLLEHKQDSVHNIISFVGFNCKYKAKRNSYNIHKLLYKPKKKQTHCVYSGEAAAGCSAHDDGCDGSTGTTSEIHSNSYFQI